MEAKGLCEISMEEFDKMRVGGELRLYLKSDMDEIVIRITKDELRKISLAPLPMPISKIKSPRRVSTSTRKLMSMSQRKRWAKIKGRKEIRNITRKRRER